MALRRFLVPLLLVGCWACNEVPPNLPTTQAYQRMAPRIELVELIIDDAERAEKVRSLYLQIEDLMRATQRNHVRQIVHLASADHKVLSPDQVREMFAAFSKEERMALEKYIDLQMQLRASVTPEEFARLDALK